MKAKLLEKLEQFLDNLQIESGDISNTSADHDEPSKQGKFPVSVPGTAHEVSEIQNDIYIFFSFFLIGFEYEECQYFF